ncbi:LemA protein [Aquimarina sp. EL_43]|uniref:LemA family protein n=1 Tax=unclassified Aquimarina TaxID=2627091 RepID=UPI0018CA5D8E|nr:MULTISPECIES: LemA family protein [unclassified Aquimarina]MBG6130684.1 LemA protein [Aquimarina sp. EL_35]MBG6151170.1 LemA protein [Aquimarina sp. EL_32]MBG6169086.1 LemA protein [Aquimarina sp. EL_43]
MGIAIIVAIAVVLLILIVGVIINNQIIAKKNQVAQAYGSIEIYLKKRFDLIPNLVATLNKYLAHEKEILLKVTELRGQIEKAIEPKAKIEASNELTKVMSGLNINVENYPDLKADTQFINLQFELSDIEDQISAARRAFNAAVTSYNNKIQMFPASIIAGIRKDKAETLLEIPKAEQKEVNINQLLNN